MVHYCKMGSTVLTNYVQEIKPIDGDVKLSSERAPGYDRAFLAHDGRAPRGWELQLLGLDSESNLEAVVKALNEASLDTAFYPYTADKFARVAVAGAWEDKHTLKAHHFWRGRAKIWSATPYLFADSETSWTPNLGDLQAITPAGSISAPLDALSITGLYSGGNHLKEPTIKIWDNAGAVLQDSVILAPRLLSSEVLTLDYAGKIIQTYSDDFASSTRWTQDAVNDGSSHGSGVITVGNENSFYYWLKGLWPLSSSIQVTADIVISAGTPVLEYSFDGTNWFTAYSGTQLTSARTWVIPNTKGHTDVYIRFRSCSSDFATLTTAQGSNKDITFTARKSGTSGNSVSMTYVKPGVTTPLSVSVSSLDVTVTLGTSGSTVVSTANDVMDLLWSDLPTLAVLGRIWPAPGSDGTGKPGAMSKTYLAGATITASMTVDNLSIQQIRQVPARELPLVPLGATYKVEIDEAAAGSSGSATISAAYRDRFWI